MNDKLPNMTLGINNRKISSEKLRAWLATRDTPLDHILPPAPAAGQPPNAAAAAELAPAAAALLEAQSKKVFNYIKCVVSEELLPHVLRAGTATAAWAALEALFRAGSTARTLALKKKFQNLKLGKGSILELPTSSAASAWRQLYRQRRL
jgi:hypothetical protein